MSNRATLHWPCGDTQGLFRFSSQGSHKGCPYQMTNRGSHTGLLLPDKPRSDVGATLVVAWGKGMGIGIGM